MKEALRLIAAATAASLAVFATAQTSAKATIREVGQSGGNYTYDLDLTNTGSTNIGTFWYSWVPGQNYLPALPPSADVVSPAGWSLGLLVNGGGVTDGYSIQWVASTPLAAGNSLDGFQFTIAAAPSVIFGASPFHSKPPIDTSFVYSGAPFSGTSAKFVATPVPEPISMFAMGAGLLGILARRRRR